MSPCHPRIDIPACSISLGIGMRSTIRDTLDIRASTDIKENLRAIPVSIRRNLSYPYPSFHLLPSKPLSTSPSVVPPACCRASLPTRHQGVSFRGRASEKVSVSIRVAPPIEVRDPRVDGDARRTMKRYGKFAGNTGIPTTHQ